MAGPLFVMQALFGVVERLGGRRTAKVYPKTASDSTAVKLDLWSHTDRSQLALRRATPTKTVTNPTVVKLSYGSVVKFYGSHDCIAFSS